MSVSVMRIHKFTPYQEVLNAVKEVFTSKTIAFIIINKHRTVLVITLASADEFNPYTKNMIPEPGLNWTFKDYIQKFKPTRVWSDMEDKNKEIGVNKTLKEEFQNIYNRIDETDELLNLTVRNGDPKMVLNKDGRRWKPPGRIVPNTFDRFSIRRRLLELMKQAIYQARNKMVMMQLIREKYRTQSLYKMGFLISKTDITCKIFAGFTYKAYKTCSNARQKAVESFPLIDLLEANERQLDLWFDVDLLVDLIVVNHDNCKRMLNQVYSNRKHAWKFID